MNSSDSVYTTAVSGKAAEINLTYQEEGYSNHIIELILHFLHDYGTTFRWLQLSGRQGFTDSLRFDLSASIVNGHLSLLIHFFTEAKRSSHHMRPGRWYRRLIFNACFDCDNHEDTSSAPPWVVRVWRYILDSSFRKILFPKTFLLWRNQFS